MAFDERDRVPAPVWAVRDARAPRRLRAAIADDEAGARIHLRGLLEDCRVIVIGEYAGGQDAVQAAERAKPDMICLDVRMPDLDGLEAARRLGPAASIIFTTGFADHAAAAFDLGAVDYLMKPLTPARVAEAVRRVRARIATVATDRDAVLYPAPGGAPRVLIPTGDHRVALSPEVIRFVEAQAGDTVFHTDRGTFRLRLSLARIERTLAPWGFLRTHRAYLVNLARVQALIPWSRTAHSLLLDGGQETHVPVAKSRLAAFRGSVIWIPHSGGPRSGSGTAGEGGDRHRREPRAGPGDRRRVGR